MSKNNNTAKIKLKQHPFVKDKSYLITLPDGNTHYIPKSSIFGYTPATLIIEVETWLLTEKGIPFKI